MIQSKINESVYYNEHEKIEINDMNANRVTYKLIIKDIPIIAVIGNKMQKSVMAYYPLYLITHKCESIQIGLYEINNTKSLPMIPNNVEYMNDPIIYSFATEKFIKQNALEFDRIDFSTNEPITVANLINTPSQQPPTVFIPTTPENSPPTTPENSPPPSPTNKLTKIDLPDIFTKTIVENNITTLQEETEEMSIKLRKIYNLSKATNWVQRFTQNLNYNLLDNEGGGDCFFAAVRDAYKTIGQLTTVPKLRNILSNNITKELFNTYKTQYNEINNAIVEMTKQINELKGNTDKAKQYKILVNERKVSIQMANEYSMMKNINTLEDFKRIVKTCAFWADMSSIEIIEHLIGAKIIIMSSQMYANGEIDNVIQCGIHTMNNKLPTHYIMLDYTGSHYKLITYKNVAVFSYTEIPIDIRKMIVDKCLENNAGVFSKIPEFIAFKNKIEHEKLVTHDQMHKQQLEEIDELQESSRLEMYDPLTTFMIYNKSADVAPGKGTNENILKTKRTEFAELAKTKDWRRKLDDTWMQTFTLDEHNWPSVEHYIIAAMFKSTPEFYKQFTTDSDSEIANSIETARIAITKSGKLKDKIIRPPYIQIDTNYETHTQQTNQQNAQYAKFTQNTDLKDILLKTKDAKLTIYVRGESPKIANTLMVNRMKLSTSIE